MKKRTKSALIFLGVVAVLFLLVIWVLWANKALEVNEITVESNKIPKAFDGYIITHVSDLHNDEIGEGNKDLLDMLRASEPDMIAMTGDIVDSVKAGEDVAYDFISKAVEIAPCYFVTGNHEPRSPEKLAVLDEKLEAFGVVVLHNDKVELEVDGEKITIGGVDGYYVNDEVLNTSLENIAEGEDYTILLAHRPEFFNKYVESGIDLVLSGHAHGGQFRLPLIGGLYAPGQGLFPEYDSGMYTEDSTNMIVSRGIGNSLIPLRFNNRPEVILVELKSK